MAVIASRLLSSWQLKEFLRSATKEMVFGGEVTLPTTRNAFVVDRELGDIQCDLYRYTRETLLDVEVDEIPDLLVTLINLGDISF